MRINFNEIKEQVIPEFKGGEGNFIARMYTDENNKIMFDKLEPGASIGLHTHETNSEIIYLISGSGRVIYDDTEEELLPGECHYCPMGHTHSLINAGTDMLVFFAVVPEHIHD